MLAIYSIGRGGPRLRCQFLIFCLLIVCLWRALPLDMAVLLLVANTRMARSALSTTRINLVLEEGQWHQVWMCQFALCVVGQETLWVFRDELPTHEWAKLRRYLRIYTPRKPWGLSISR